jgi:hypothetical protein
VSPSGEEQIWEKENVEESLIGVLRKPIKAENLI